MTLDQMTDIGSGRSDHHGIEWPRDEDSDYSDRPEPEPEESAEESDMEQRIASEFMRQLARIACGMPKE